jgi:hypothetical protein
MPKACSSSGKQIEVTGLMEVKVSNTTMASTERSALLMERYSKKDLGNTSWQFHTGGLVRASTPTDGGVVLEVLNDISAERLPRAQWIPAIESKEKKSAFWIPNH